MRSVKSSFVHSVVFLSSDTLVRFTYKIIRSMKKKKSDSGPIKKMDKNLLGKEVEVQEMEKVNVSGSCPFSKKGRKEKSKDKIR